MKPATFPAISPGPADEILQGVSDDPGDLKWVLQSYLPKGALCVLSARHKVGKSSLVYGLSRAVLAGELFLGQPTTQCPVLVLQLEEARQLVAINRRRYGLAAVAQHHHLYVGPVYDRKGVITQVRKYVKKHGIGLVIIDTISRAWTVQDENSVADVLQAMIPWSDLAHETGATVLALHHWGHSAKRARGASSFGDVADMILNLERLPKADRADPRRVLTCEGRYTDFIPTTPCVLITRDGMAGQSPRWRGWNEIANDHDEDDHDGPSASFTGDHDSGSVTPTGRRILAYLAERTTPAPSATMRADLSEISKAGLYRNLNTLEEAGFITEDAAGCTITATGRQALVPAEFRENP